MVTVKVLGTGCPKCRTLEKNAREAIAEMSIEAEVVKVSKVRDIMQYDVMMTPALVVDEEVVVSGKVPSPAEIKALIEAELAKK